MIHIVLARMFRENIKEFQILLSGDGQIIIFLLNGEASAGDIFNAVQCSQATVSRKLARLVDTGILECRISKGDRRVMLYKVSERYITNLNRHIIGETFKI